MNKLNILLFLMILSLTVGLSNATTTTTTTTTQQYGLFTSTSINPNIYTLNNNTIPNNPTSIVNLQNSSSYYSATLIIYSNPLGFFEYALSPHINQKAFLDNPKVYENMKPNQNYYSKLQLPSNMTNKTTLNSYLNKYKYDGIIYFTSQDNSIIGIENYSVNGTNLYPYQFFNFISVKSNLNSTLVFKTNNTNINMNNLIKSIPSLLFGITNPVLGSLGLINNQKNNPIFTNKEETNINPQYVTPYVSQLYINTEPIKIYYNIDNRLITNPNSAKAVTEFNRIYDSKYLPAKAENNFFQYTIPSLFLITIILFILQKFNGE